MSCRRHILLFTAALIAVAYAKPKPIAITPCGGNMHYEECGTDCPAYCNGPKDAICNKMCRIGCFCDSGFVLDKKGGDFCVRADQCPPQSDDKDTFDKCALVFCAPGDICKDGVCARNPICPVYRMMPPKEGCEYVEVINPANGCPHPVQHCPGEQL